MPDVLGLTIDTAEVRTKTDRIALLIPGSKNNTILWDPALGEGWCIDPVTSTIMFQPYPWRAEWDTTATTATPASPYYRIGKASTNHASNDAYVEQIPNNVDGNVYLYSKATNALISPLGTFEKNRAWFFSYFPYGQGENFLQFEAVWGTVKLDIYSDGSVQIYKGALQVGSGNISKLDDLDAPTKRVGTGSQGGRKHRAEGTVISFVVIPWRTRELLFLCNKGGAFSAVFEDIPITAPNPIILPAGPMSYQVPNGQVNVQAAPVSFTQSAFILSQSQEMREAPVSGASPTVGVYWDLPSLGTAAVTGTLKQVDGTTAFVGDGSTKTARARIDFTGDGRSSPWIYAHKSVFAAVTANTDDTHSESLDDYTTEAHLSVPDAAEGVALAIQCKEPAALSLVVANAKTGGNRPFVAKIGTIAIVTGRSKSPQFIDGPVDEGNRILWECADRWRSFETHAIMDPTPFDGLRLKAAIEELARYPGWPAGDMDVEDIDYTLPIKGQSSNGKWSLIPEDGDKVGDWLNRLHSQYHGIAIMGWYPSATGPKFRFRTPLSIGTTPSATLYRTRAAAIAAGRSADDYAATAWWRHVVKDGYSETRVEPEANKLRVSGWDSRIDKSFQVFSKDDASINPVTFPAARPDNWIGEVRQVSAFYPEANTLAHTSFIEGVLRSRLFPGVWLAEIPCEMQFKTGGVPLWRGDVLRVDGVGNWRILSFTVDHVVEYAARVARNCTYTCKFIPGSA